MQEIELKLSTDEVNLILEALGNMPFKQVFSLIGKIQNQASSQLSNVENEQEGSILPSNNSQP